MTDSRLNRGRMRARSVVGEAWRNLTSGTSKVVVLSLTAAAVLAALTWTETSSITRITEDAQQYQEVAASVQVLFAPMGINPAACEALNEVDGVRAAGAVRDSTDEISAAALPQSNIGIKDITPGIANLLGVDGSSTLEGLIISRQVAEALNLQPGDELPSSTGTQRVQGIYDYPDDGRIAGYGYAIMNPALPEGRYDACWADIWPENAATTALLWIALDSDANTTDSPPSIGQLNSTHGANFTGAAEFDNRVTKYNVIVAIITLFLLSYLAIRLRRLELAAALHTGVNKSAQAAQLLLETSVWITCAIVLTTPVVTLGIIDAMPADRGAIVATTARIIAAGIAAAILGTMCGTALTKEKHLFRYFKER